MLTWFRRWYSTFHVIADEAVRPVDVAPVPYPRLRTSLNSDKKREVNSAHLTLVHPNPEDITVFDVWNRAKMSNEMMPDGEYLSVMLNREDIPEAWASDDAGNTRYIYFVGGVYQDEEGYECVYVLHKNESGWRRDVAWMEDMLGSHATIALFQNK